MITRIVRMTFDKDKVNDFKKVFKSVQSKIANFPGCEEVNLYQEFEKENVYFTYSIWQSNDALQAYRSSPLFKDTWSRTKPLFIEKAQAWTLQKSAEA